jgi:hypothetical protein
MLKTVCVVALLAIASPSLAQSNTSDAAPAPKPKKERQECRDNGYTGSRMATSRTCHTKAEWAAIDQQSSVDTQRTVDAARSGR